ncbi:MAG TPA: secondary thiamine-phosphate synthase enzyme YjbQ [Opitutaceae bacterium]|jgi:secondary thiamine-phosphate synthase enzyme|nr:secondary thiamine-phosphate synthase enzyme YjbQ [Opitutaceae bacterium]MBP8961895.1 secondary thiamine-phosphate synthase enzyme YjbQ [Opitutaceae bacterium]HOF09068.1 secondary thiamine-phosphate synthase enzyme YjbQ [Opitutaceae bacterium]HOR24730.1 secondary thiamine-phosphate synthase enzyme YjbQ [Opitutaceae bacterium]HOY55573.1 secondary thiamine-phosphate synthase enzyme YjbQ [Opitutaceae bacterium]
MPAFQDTLACRTRGTDTYEITREVAELVRRSGIRTGVASVFCPHTSCSLVLMENADPSARRDLQAWLDRLVPAHDRHFTHTLEGPDDMPSHIKMALTRSSETIPVHEGRLRLGTWQGLFLWEHRQAPHARELIVTVIGD